MGPAFRHSLLHVLVVEVSSFSCTQQHTLCKQSLPCYVAIVRTYSIPAVAEPNNILSFLQSKAVATAAAEAATAVLANMNANAVRLVLPMLFDAMSQKQKWQTKVGALQQLGALTKTAPAQMKLALPDIVPAVAGCFADAKPQVKVNISHSQSGLW